jgi:molybdopterin-guanine dinucleotide biosynthesis protein A
LAANVYDLRVREFTAFVLAGGKSTRMGTDKAFLDFRGKTLLQRALDTLRSLTPEVMIVGERNKYVAFAPVVEDVFRARGPLGGIHAALAATATDLNLLLAVDLPFVQKSLLSFLLNKAAQTDALAVVPRTDGYFQTLCAIFRKDFGQVAEESLQRGENKIDAVFERVKVMIVEEDELARRGFPSRMFSNLNTPQELQRAKRQRS